MTHWIPVADFDAAYDNSGAVQRSDTFVPRWQREASAFRDVMEGRRRSEIDLAYGAHERQKLDLFHPEGPARGLVVFVHGGYWKALEKSVWSHLARGAVESGFAVAMPSYRLAPEARLTEIAEDVGQAITLAARRVEGGIRLVGHSAGGHLVARMVAAGSPLPGPVLARVDRVVPISGLHDLRPIRRTRMNDTLRIDAAEALAQSPALLEPLHICPIHAVVGAAELPELRRQTHFLASAWSGLGVPVEAADIPDRHHFDVIEDLALSGSQITRVLTSGASL
ncbi:alpha/beta hydrolase [Aureimonas sp. N4]|uniref:alpha/beta hydrolase n=1 Tax=Aureimonas sp. N4 TaxID=1638165 RepID=UPI0007816CCC|nr:alpha/beta hydrolase [Aureimonas sp. N4]